MRGSPAGTDGGGTRHGGRLRARSAHSPTSPATALSVGLKNATVLSRTQKHRKHGVTAASAWHRGVHLFGELADWHMLGRSTVGAGRRLTATARWSIGIAGSGSDRSATCVTRPARGGCWRASSCQQPSWVQLGESLPAWPVSDEVPVAIAQARERAWLLVALTNSDRHLIDASFA